MVLGLIKVEVFLVESNLRTVLSWGRYDRERRKLGGRMLVLIAVEEFLLISFM